LVDICMWCLRQAAAAAEVRRLELSLQEERERLRRQAEAETLPGGEAAWRTDAVVEAAAVSPLPMGFVIDLLADVPLRPRLGVLPARLRCACVRGAGAAAAV